LVRKEQKIPALQSQDPRRREAGEVEWRKGLETLQRALYEACGIMQYRRHIQQIQLGIMERVGGIDSHSMKQRVREIFEDFDLDHSGTVDVEELGSAFARLGVEMQEAEVRKFMGEFDSDGSGLIEFEEFLLIVESILLEARNALDDPAQVFTSEPPRPGIPSELQERSARLNDRS
jgi:hypothetical protein